MSAEIAVLDLGRRRYGEVLELQRNLCRRKVAGEITEDLLLLVEHQPVVTLGRSAKASSMPVPRKLLEARGVEVFEVERGGDVTLHAPGQLVGYPIIDLSRWKPDLHWYLRQLEASLIGALGNLGITAQRNPGKTGVWTGGRKIASIGIHVKQWITLHGFALNITTDLALFDLIVPCGIPDVVMTSVEREREQPERGDALFGVGQTAVVAEFGRAFEREMVERPLAYLGVPEIGAPHPG